MNKESANLWICGNPEEITEILGVKPTSVRRKQPYDYWDFEVKKSENSECCSDMISFLKTVKDKITIIKEKYTLGIIFFIETSEDGSETFLDLEPDEMLLFGNLGIPVTFQIIFKQKTKDL